VTSRFGEPTVFQTGFRFCTSEDGVGVKVGSFSGSVFLLLRWTLGLKLRKLFLEPEVDGFILSRFCNALSYQLATPP
jgi:hypothetical protein